ncbi:MAG: hypothetical protein HFG51_13205 [Lachnospiraceae bacterium]|nr:hypothetical protein [Lachnospiraceae bacterium]
MVKEITGYDSLEVLRQQYIKDLETGNWSFNSFAGFADNKSQKICQVSLTLSTFLHPTSISVPMPALAMIPERHLQHWQPPIW